MFYGAALSTLKMIKIIQLLGTDIMKFIIYIGNIDFWNIHLKYANSISKSFNINWRELTRNWEL